MRTVSRMLKPLIFPLGAVLILTVPVFGAAKKQRPIRACATTVASAGANHSFHRGPRDQRLGKGNRGRCRSHAGR